MDISAFAECVQQQHAGQLHLYDLGCGIAELVSREISTIRKESGWGRGVGVVVVEGVMCG